MDRLAVAIRLAVLAFVALLGVAPGARVASACAMRMSDGSSCGARAKCCCTARPSSATAPHRVGMLPPIAVPAVARIGPVASCPTACCGEGGAPAAPEPRIDRGGGSSLAGLVRFATPLVLFAPADGGERRSDAFLAVERSPDAPIYLRCERLLT